MWCAFPSFLINSARANSQTFQSTSGSRHFSSSGLDFMIQGLWPGSVWIKSYFKKKSSFFKPQQMIPRQAFVCFSTGIIRNLHNSYLFCFFPFSGRYLHTAKDLKSVIDSEMSLKSLTVAPVISSAANLSSYHRLIGHIKRELGSTPNKRHFLSVTRKRHKRDCFKYPEWNSIIALKVSVSYF